MVRNRRARVLIVDDEPDMVWALKRILSSSGYSIFAASTAGAALEIMRRENADLALVDAMLPDMDTDDLIAALRALRPGLRIVMISGYFYLDDMSIQRRLRSNQVQGFVGKPFDVAEFRALLGDIMLEHIPRGDP